MDATQNRSFELKLIKVRDLDRQAQPVATMITMHQGVVLPAGRWLVVRCRDLRIGDQLVRPDVLGGGGEAGTAHLLDRAVASTDAVGVPELLAELEPGGRHVDVVGVDLIRDRSRASWSR